MGVSACCRELIAQSIKPWRADYNQHVDELARRAVHLKRNDEREIIDDWFTWS